jgi:hypothetical protein
LTLGSSMSPKYVFANFIYGKITTLLIAQQPLRLEKKTIIITYP